MNKHLDRTGELSASKIQQDQISKDSSKILDNEHVYSRTNDVGSELITLNQYHAEEARNDSSGNQSKIVTKETINLPLPCNQQITSKNSTTRKYPWKVLFIAGNEFCERFSFYGFRTILLLYFKIVLGFSDSNSTVLFHIFTSLCYLTPIFGAILADSYLGKFNTILYLSIVYLFGEVILTLSSVFWNYGAIAITATFFGLFMISIGTGGIKPCVCALGGDQFLDNEQRWRQSFFSIFYFAINSGSLISMFLTPILRSDFKCFGRADCYPLGFGVPCALMFVAIIVFLLAKNKYNLVPLPKQNVIVAFCKCTWLASKRKLFGNYNYLPPSTPINKVTNHHNVSTVSILEQESASSLSSSMNSGEDVLISANSLNKLNDKQQYDLDHINNKAVGLNDIKRKEKDKISYSYSNNKKLTNNHWLYLTSDRFDSATIEDFRAILNILLILVPFPIYFCLYNQQSSLWTLQANRMDGRVFDTGYVLEPDQISVMNPILVLILLPLFEIIIYPSLSKNGLLTKPIQRMTFGGMLASLAFITSGLIELQIQQFLPSTQLPPGQANFLILNGLNECSIVSPVISYKPTLPFIGGSSNFTTAQQTDLTNLLMVNHTFDKLQPLNVQSLMLLSSNASLLDSYQLEFKLSSAKANNLPSSTSLVYTGGCPFSPTIDYGFNLKPLPEGSVRLLYLTQGNGKLEYKVFNETLELPKDGKARVRLLYEAFGSSNEVNKRQFYLTRLSTIDPNYNSNSNNKINKTSGLIFETKLKDGLVVVSENLDISVPTKGETFVLQTNDGLIGMKKNHKKIFLKPATRNLIVVHQEDAVNFRIKHNLLQDNDYRISMLYQMVPYILISSAEIMFDITSLEFFYGIAPTSMKSVVLGMNSLTNSFGNVLIVLIESMHLFSDIATDFFFYATIMALDMGLLAIIGYYYRPYNSKGEANK